MHKAILSLPDDTGWHGVRVNWRGSLWTVCRATDEIRGEDATVSLQLLAIGPMPAEPAKQERQCPASGTVSTAGK